MPTARPYKPRRVTMAIINTTTQISQNLKYPTLFFSLAARLIVAMAPSFMLLVPSTHFRRLYFPLLLLNTLLRHPFQLQRITQFEEEIYTRKSQEENWRFNGASSRAGGVSFLLVLLTVCVRRGRRDPKPRGDGQSSVSTGLSRSPSSRNHFSLSIFSLIYFLVAFIFWFLNRTKMKRKKRKKKKYFSW